MADSNGTSSSTSTSSAPSRPTSSREGRGPSKQDNGASSPASDTFDPTQLRDRVVVQLLFHEKVQIEQVDAAWQQWNDMRKNGSSEALWRILAQHEEVDREAVYAAAAEVYAFRRVTCTPEDALAFVRGIEDIFSEEQWQRMIELRVLPVALEDEEQSDDRKLIIATHDPARTEIHRLLQSINLNRFELQYAPESMVLEIISEAFPQKNKYLDRLGEDIAYDLGTSYEDGDQLVDEEALEAEISRSKLINLFEAMLVEAVRSGASDIHLFPNARRHVEIHFRIDGELEPWHVEERIHPEAFLAVAKDNAVNVDRFERDAAQDGAIQRRIDEAIIRFRVSVLPTVTAEQNVRSESIVIRVLDDRKVVKDLSKLGLNQLALDRFHHAIRQPYGMVILTGPTGSGKTTTLYAALHEVVTPKINVLTAEDPVEYILPGVRQIKLSHKLQLESALRSILRHDPDVVMVGEMRDRPTAELAIKLANTGHLTFSTLHTNDAPSAVSRLYKMGIEPFLIAYAINLVVAQRLIRVLCPACKVEETPDEALLERMGFSEEAIDSATFYTHAPSDTSCKNCGGSGYSGRRAISETMLFTPEIRHIIVAADELVDEDKLRKTAMEQGMLTLQASARERVKDGETSIQEMMRVVFTDF